MNLPKTLSLIGAAGLGLSALITCRAAAAEPEDAITPPSRIELFNGRDFTGWTFCLKSNAEPAKTWSVTNGAIVCTGRPTGYARTEKNYRDFQLTVEWRFTKPGNTGALVFMQEPDKVWPNCIECQGMHDHMGDFWLQGGAKANETPNMSRNGIKMLQPSNESPVGEWTTFQVVCRSNTVEIIVNGKSMNKITGCNAASGHIGLQSEGAAMEVRKVFLEPLK